MSMEEYETIFHELSHTKMILPIKEGRVRFFVRGLWLKLWLETQSVVFMGHYFLAITMENLCHEAKAGSERRSRHAPTIVIHTTGLRIIMTWLDGGFHVVGLASLPRPLLRHQMVLGARQILVRVVMYLSRFLQRMIVILLRVALARV